MTYLGENTSEARFDRWYAGSVVSRTLFSLLIFIALCTAAPRVEAALTLTSGNNATTTPSVATSITGFQIVGPSSSTTPVKLRATSGTLSLSTVSGVTMSGNNSGTVNLSGTVANLNTALSTLTYTRGSTGTDTLEVSLVEPTEVFFADNGHLYKFTSGSYTWSQAKTAAAAQTAYTATGYLATITSSAENTFVYARITGDGWLSATDSQTEKTWKWDAGPEAGTSFFQENPTGGGGSAISSRYHAWASGEPNDYGSGEDCGYMYSSQSGQWNDFPCSAQQGYVVEFGADGNLPVVVATNISVVTADVPAVTTLSPANGSTTASPSANLVIGFTKTVTRDTGTITIRKSADDSIVESIDVTGSQVTGSGSSSITINPSVTLDEGTQYYVLIPSTAFKDGSSNYFEGITATTTWRFTTSDETAPTLSAISAASSVSTAATVTWTTNETASSKIIYGLTSSLASSTAEADTGTRVTSHSVALSSLLECTTYYYAVVSRDASLNSATSSTNTFTTAGCTSNVEPTVATSTAITSSSGGTTSVETESKTFAVNAPSNVTDEASTIVIQVRAMPKDDILSDLGTPSASPTSVGTTVFDVKAIINGSTILESFDAEITISYEYTDDEIAGLDESTLKLYHYTGGEWVALNACSVNADANTISCTTPSFSIFGLFGTRSTPSSNGVSGGTTIQGRVANLLASGNTTLAQQLMREYPQAFPVQANATNASCPKFRFTRALKRGMQGDDVRELQKFLNCQGFSLGSSGPGSPGNESLVFAGRTYDAVVNFQEKYAADVLAPAGLANGTGLFAVYSQKKAHALMGVE